jgi:hypothetical protein
MFLDDCRQGANLYLYKGIKDGGAGYEHRVQAEKAIGRKLEAGEVVHHIDDDKHNNDPENLMVFKQRSDHARFHRLLPRKREVFQLTDNAYICRSIPNKRQCLQCDRLFTPTNTRSGDRAQKYCSRECKLAKQTSTSLKPSKEDLKDLLMSHSFLSISKKIGVSDNTVRKWCRSLDLPFDQGGVQALRMSANKTSGSSQDLGNPTAATPSTPRHISNSAKSQ